jgi:hypothetical protein
VNSFLLGEMAASAARLVVEEGMEYAAAKRRAARDVGHLRGGSRIELPSNEAVEDAVREHIALFCADTQPDELAALRALALTWLQRLAEFRPHLSGAVWRGTATRLSAIHIDLYADDAKAPEIALINQGIDYDTDEASGAGRRGEPLSVLSLAARCAELNERVTLHLTVHDHDDLRGALVPDAAGRRWRGDARALARLVEEGAA